MRIGVISVLIAACSYPQPADVQPMDGPHAPIDGKVGSDAPSHDAQAGCPLATTYTLPLLSGSNQYAENQPAVGSQSPHFEDYQVELDTQVPLVAFFVVLFAESQQYPSDVTVGAADLSANANNTSACGACVYLADAGSNGTITDLYVAQSGQLNMSSIAPATGSGQWTGTVSNLGVFVHIGSNGALDPGCEATLDTGGNNIPMNAAIIAD